MSDDDEKDSQEPTWRMVHQVETGEVSIYFEGHKLDGLARAGMTLGDDGRARLHIEVCPPTLEIERFVGEQRVGHIAAADRPALEDFQRRHLRETIDAPHPTAPNSDHRPASRKERY